MSLADDKMRLGAPFFILDGPDGPWGDYSHILIHGMASNEPYPDGPIHLERSGPFIPPISFPGAGSFVVTSEFRNALDQSALAGLTFRPVIMKKIVRLDWTEWDQTLADRPVFPESGEPEDYIYEQPHSPETEAQLGELWEARVENAISVEREPMPDRPWDSTIFYLVDTWDGRDFFGAETTLITLVSTRARVWLEAKVPEWVSFEESLIR